VTDVEQARRRLEAAGVRYVFGAYTDLNGVPKSKCVPIGHFEDMAAGSELYTVGALEGMGKLGPNEDECVGVPDLDSLTVLPWDSRYAIAAADLYFHGRPYSHDARRVLRRQVAAAAAMGYLPKLGVEPELYVLRQVGGQWRPFVASDLDNQPTRGYDLEATMLADPFLDPMVTYLDELGWDVYSFDHEGGDGQYEFDFGYTDALAMADRMVVFRLLAKHVARSLGCIATFMPKPWSEAFGSGAHYNLSLADPETGANLFQAEGGEPGAAGVGDRPDRGYSELAYQFTAGVLEHAGAITAVVCPTVNSYKRMLPRGLMNEISWAPVYRAYGHNNRTLMCRLPMNRRCLELRIADSACNFYLGAAITLAAGLDGIQRRLKAGDPVNVDTYSVGDEELEASGVRRVPATLGEAVDEFEADPLAKEVFGAELHATYASVRRAEWAEYNTVVGEWERQRYLRLW
jgi:glutamine synthetase